MNAAEQLDASVALTSPCASSLLHGEVRPLNTMWKATHGCGANQVELSRVSLFQFSCFLDRFVVLSTDCVIVRTYRSLSGNHIISVFGLRKVM